MRRKHINFGFLSLGITGTYEPIERLKERQGKGMAEAKAIETPSKRTKKTDKAKLVRQVNILKDIVEDLHLRQSLQQLVLNSNQFILLISEFQSNWKTDNRRRC